MLAEGPARGAGARVSEQEFRRALGYANSAMDLLLTHGYFLHEDPKELQIMKPYAPLGILYLSSHLRAKGFDVEVYDSPNEYLYLTASTVAFLASEDAGFTTGAYVPVNGGLAMD